jgi:hypothetical protein
LPPEVRAFKGHAAFQNVPESWEFYATAVTVVDPIDKRREFLTPAVVGRKQIRLMLAGGNKAEQHDADRQRFITGHAQPKLLETAQ